MNIKQYNLLAAAVLMLAACSKSDDLGVPQNGNYPQDGVVRISTTVNELKTRAGEQPYTGADLSLSVDYGTSDKYTQPNVKWTTADNGTTWTPATQMLWKNATTATKIYAYAPHQASVTDLTAVPFTVATDQSAGLASSDLLGYFNSSFVPGSSLTTKNAMDIDLSHKLSKLTINITFGSQFETAPTIGSLLANSVEPTVVYNATTGVVSTTTGNAISIKAYALSATSYDVILPAQTIAAGTKMLTVILANGEAYHYTVPASGHDFVNGAAYTMTLKVGKDKLEITSVTVEEWATGGILPGGEAIAPNPVVISRAGTLTEDLIVAGVNGGKKLIIQGPMNAGDFKTIYNWATLNATNNNSNRLHTLDLTGVTGLAYLPSNAFYTAPSNVTHPINDLRHVYLPAEFTIVGTDAFRYCGSLVTVTAPGLEQIFANAFTNCTSLVKFDATDKLKRVYNEAFMGCRELTEFIAPELTAVDGLAFSYCPKLTKFIAPKLRTLGSLCFRNSSLLSEFFAPELKTLPNQAFEEVILTEFNGPKVTYIGEMSFYKCLKIETMRLTAAANIALNKEAFSYFPSSGCTLYLHQNKMNGGSGSPTVDEEGKWGGVAWKNIVYVDDAGNEVPVLP